MRLVTNHWPFRRNLPGMAPGGARIAALFLRHGAAGGRSNRWQCGLWHRGDARRSGLIPLVIVRKPVRNGRAGANRGMFPQEPDRSARNDAGPPHAGKAVLMTADRLRMVGGPMSGQTLWLDKDKDSLRVHTAATQDSPKRTYEYRRDGQGLL